MTRVSRPLSPHLQVYKPQLTSVLSICHRISGVVLTGCALFLVYWLVSLAGGEQSYADARSVLGSWWCQILLFFGSVALFYHFCNGIRHLIWDAGYGFELEAVYTSGWLVIIATGVLTVVTWVLAYALS